MYTLLLLVEDNPHDAFQIRDAFADLGSEIVVVETRTISETLRVLANIAFDCILLDLNLDKGPPPYSYGLDTLRRVHAAAPDTPIVVLTDTPDRDNAFGAECLREGAEDFLPKWREPAQRIERVLRFAQIRQEQRARERTEGMIVNENFNTDFKLVEAGAMKDSASATWWLNSGAYFEAKQSVGWTIHGRLPKDDPWRKRYYDAGGETRRDTEDGYEPQNLFRLVTRPTFDSFEQRCSFLIAAYNAVDSPERDAWNGLLLMSHYREEHLGQDLYYAGVRVDGHAVIKKKRWRPKLRRGVYTTLKEVRGIFPGTFDRASGKILLPMGKWLKLRFKTTSNPDGSVDLGLFLTRPGTSAEELIASVRDNGTVPAADGVRDSPVPGPGHAGIRTDFMDVRFENYSAS
jgi:CheY-like chemotaxis protein